MSIQTTRLRDIEKMSRPVVPGERHKLGASYFCSYWQFVYEVVAIDGCTVTVHCPASGETWSHCTALSRGDRRLV
jgi:hypothetical protein